MRLQLLWSAALLLTAGSATPVYDLSPPQQPLQLQQHHKAPPRPYAFDYAVKVAEQALDFAQREAQNAEGEVSGEYRVLLPDGRTQVVTYSADHRKGYRATVTYEGEAQAPQQPQLETYSYTTGQAAAEPVEQAAAEAAAEDPAAASEEADATGSAPAPAAAEAVLAAAEDAAVVTARPVPTQPAPEPNVPSPSSLQRGYPRYPAEPSTGYLPAQPQFGRPPAALYGAPARPQYSATYAPQRPRSGYLPPPTNVYFSSRPAAAPLLPTAAVVAEEEEEEEAPPVTTAAPSTTTPGLPEGAPLPQFAVDPIPVAPEVKAAESGSVSVRQPEISEEEGSGGRSTELEVGSEPPAPQTSYGYGYGRRG